MDQRFYVTTNSIFHIKCLIFNDIYSIMIAEKIIVNVRIHIH